VARIGKKPVSGQSHEPFWDRGTEKLMRNDIKLIELAGETPSISKMDRVVRSLPTQLGMEANEQYKATQYAGQLMNAIIAKKHELSEDQLSDLELVGSYIFDQWPAFDERPRSIIEMMWSGMADKFRFNPLNHVFCGGKCDFTPEDTTHRNKIIICDWPLLEYGHETGRTINIILKLVFQRAWLRRKI
jgi:hypothetical protein